MLAVGHFIVTSTIVAVGFEWRKSSWFGSAFLLWWFLLQKCVFSCPYAARCWWPKICCPTWDLWQTYSAHTSDCLWREASMKKAYFILPTAGLTIRSPQTVFFLRYAWLEINLGECFVVHWLVWEWECLAKVLVSGIGTGSIFEECDCFLMMFLVLNLSF